jgi:hypothetical protein
MWRAHAVRAAAAASCSLCFPAIAQAEGERCTKAANGIELPVLSCKPQAVPAQSSDSSAARKHQHVVLGYGIAGQAAVDALLSANSTSDVAVVDSTLCEPLQRKGVTYISGTVTSLDAGSSCVHVNDGGEEQVSSEQQKASCTYDRSYTSTLCSIRDHVVLFIWGSNVMLTGVAARNEGC